MCGYAQWDAVQLYKDAILSSVMTLIELEIIILSEMNKYKFQVQHDLIPMQIQELLFLFFIIVPGSIKITYFR